MTFVFGPTILTLRDPLLGDTESYPQGLKFRRAMDNTLYSWVTDQQPVAISMNFANLNRNKILEILDFMRQSSGQQVILNDYKGESWQGVITNTPHEFTHAAARDNQFIINFLGTRL